MNAEMQNEVFLGENVGSYEYYPKPLTTDEYYLEKMYRLIKESGGDLGSQTVDLSRYVTTDVLNNALTNKANSTHTHTKAQITDLTIDSAPTENSTNPVTSGGVFAALNSDGHMKVDMLLNSVSTTTSTALACNWSAYDVLIFAYGWYANIRGSIVIPTSYFPYTATEHIQLFDPSSVSSTNIACRIIQIYPSGDNAVVLHSGDAGIKMWVWGVRLR